VPVSLGDEKPYRLVVASSSRSDGSASSAFTAFAPAFEALVARVGAATTPEAMLVLHRAFEQRTGAFGPDDAWFEARSRAFWDDTMTRQRAAAGMLEVLEGGERLWAEALLRSHRGLFTSRLEAGAVVVSDALTGAELTIHDLDEASRDSVASAAGYFDGTVIALTTPAGPPRLALLPGAVFHPEGVEAAIATVVVAARSRGLANDELLDALLRMELSLRTLSRVKPAYAYRAEAL
jgi:hypothetical protein